MSAAAAVRFHRVSANRKLAPIEKVPYPHAHFKYRPTPRAPFCCSTFVSIEATCSDACVFKRGSAGARGGCYVDADQFMRRAMEILDKGAAGLSSFQVIQEEVAVIDAIYKHRGIPRDGWHGHGRDLRLHVGGDAPGETSARLLAGAASRWMARGGGRVWTYTHSWQRIPREAFGAISVLASVEKPRQVSAARGRGYAPALVVRDFPDGKRPFTVPGTRFIPCPAETLGKTCVECRLCLDVDLHAKNLGIAFQVHGYQAAAVREHLVQLRPRRHLVEQARATA